MRDQAPAISETKSSLSQRQWPFWRPTETARDLVSPLLSTLPLVLALVVFLVLGSRQLQLPGLHYDESKEGGLNAMQLVLGQPVTAFRDATVQVGPWALPLMVQDYIGALNPLLAVPFLAASGLNPADPEGAVIALRWMPLLVGALTLWLTWRVARYLGGPLAAAVSALLLALSPAFIFWSRQGIFVTNLTALFFMASLLSGLHWWNHRQPRALWLTALFWGLGLYAKLLFVWAIGAMLVVAGTAWAIQGIGRKPRRARVRMTLGTLRPWLIAAFCFLLPLVPLIIFNLRTNGTFTAIFGNLGHSYYGVNNRAYLSNLHSRWEQFGALLRGDFFWYLGEAFADRYAPGVFGGLLGAAALAWLFSLVPRRRKASGAFLIPVALLALILAQSAFTVSDLFITHFVLLLPLIPLAAGLAVAAVGHAVLSTPLDFGSAGSARGGQGLLSRPSPARLASSLLLIPVLAALLLWARTDLQTTLSYHWVLGTSGGAGGHSDAIETLAKYLVQSAPSAPLALDWGLDAPVRYLTLGRVNPIEVFGYARLDQPDDGFAGRVAPFLDNPDNVYLAHSREDTVFGGRVEALSALAAAHGMALREEANIHERSGRPIFVVYRVVKATP